MTVLDEPYYGYYLKNARLGIDHPSQEQIMELMECDHQKVTAHINILAKTNDVFVKGMAHHLLMDKPHFILDWENIILVRDPEKLISSFSKVISNPTLNDIGLKKASELFSFLKENGKMPVVIESDELMKNPESYLRKICGEIDLPFSENMLRWKAGGIPEDGVWAPYWYSNVHATTGFEIQQNKSAKVPTHLEPLLKEALPYYEILKEAILKNE